MKQLRLILLMLVACVAQVSHGEDLIKKWAEAAELEKNVTTALLYAQDDNDAASRINSIIQARYMTYDESINHVYGYIKKIKGKLPKWDEKISKGKKIDYDDALKAAVCYSSSYAKLQDYSKAAKYFEAAAEGAKEDSLKAILRLSAVGCRYKADNDKAAATAAINFDIPAGSESAMICIARKYGMHDIVSEKLQQVFNVNKRQITRAIRSNNIEELKKYEIYDIPEVDSVLALKGDREKQVSLLRKCMLKHNMAWPLRQLNIEDELFYRNLSEYVYKQAFYTPNNEVPDWEEWSKYALLREIIYETICDDHAFVDKCASKVHCRSEVYDDDIYSNALSFFLLDKLDKYNRRSDAACLSMAILAQLGVTALKKHLPKDVMYDLYDYTANLIKNNVDNNPEFLNRINNVFAEYFTLSADGIAKFKATDWKTEEGANKAVNMYLLFARFITNSKVGKYEPATFDGGNRNFLQLLMCKLQENPKFSFSFTRTDAFGFVIDKEGNVIDIKQIDRSNYSKEKSEIVISAIKTLPKWKPATRNGLPIRESKIICIDGETLKFLQ